MVDFGYASPITAVDSNFWDPMHYRLGIAGRVSRGIATALATGADDPDGDWRLLSPVQPSIVGRQSAQETK